MSKTKKYDDPYDKVDYYIQHNRDKTQVTLTLHSSEPLDNDKFLEVLRDFIDDTLAKGLDVFYNPEDHSFH